MSFFTYILFSEKLQKFYTGASALTPQHRLRYHLSNHDGFTAKAKDWVIVFSVELNSKKEALALERKIKKRGAKRFLADRNLL